MAGIIAFIFLCILYEAVGFEQTLIIILAYMVALKMNDKRGD